MPQYKICKLCGKEFHYLGFMRHRAMHRDKADADFYSKQQNLKSKIKGEKNEHTKRN